MRLRITRTDLAKVSAISLAAVFLTWSLATYAAAPQSLPAPRGRYMAAKENPVISGWATEVIQKTVKNGRVKVWVYFADKGFGDDAGLAASVSAQNVVLSPRQASRRAKMGRDRVEFGDLPVRQDYVDQIVAAGGVLRHTSRWLNAASFEIDPNLLAGLAALPSVRKIDPMIGFKYFPEPTVPTAPGVGSLQKPMNTTAPDALNYGSSYSQLQQINVPAVHTLGHKGQGVIVCMMDTGFRKTHVAFAPAYAESRVLAEHDFIFNDGNTADEPADQPGQMNHGTYTWSTLGGQADGSLYGPAYGAQFLLAKTEDIRSETPIEEDNWVAGMEWAETFGVDVISSSLGYTDWYTPATYDGHTAVTSIAASHAASLGIVVCNSAGNAGYGGASTLGAPADADSMITVGAVDIYGSLAGFSSQGPTADGRTKPEVCACGVSTFCANPGGNTTYTYVSGTSLSCPLAGGCAAVILSAHPTWTPMQVREAMMRTGSNTWCPNNTYGWGIINLLAAVNYPQGTMPGDLNYDNGIDLADIIVEINAIFRGAADPPGPNTLDVNRDCKVDALDIVLLNDYVYRSGAPPPNPAP